MILQEEQTDLATPTGPMRTYVYRPVAKGRYPGLVLFSEIFQRTGPVKRTAALLAGHGFVVAVPEIFHELEPAGTEIAYDAAGADKGNKDKIGKPVSAYDADARAALQHVGGSPHCTGKLGVMGICIGGHLAFRAAMNPQVLAGACFYATDIHKGRLGLGGDDSLARTGEIRGEMLMVWGRQDPHVPAEGGRGWRELHVARVQRAARILARRGAALRPRAGSRRLSNGARSVRAQAGRGRSAGRGHVGSGRGAALRSG
jgi:carboxymethylenebutenolidase